ncbi:hypothetical protein HYFRA_00007976 [Hymenoscyphus fraxineus]|uniref:Uncharacterized protein n=1 Tax=Hymenoscyphus fraxineus TaxID=746836 RepID=A0A9N9PG41_9HELO|nr:hypothetical protein HYFRA_00007976 [Hymenoscyphus fraxineus]
MANPLNNPNNKFNLWQFHQGDPVPQEGSSELKVLRFLVKTGMHGWVEINRLYKELEADTNHRLAAADQQLQDTERQNTNMTNTVADQQRMLADQQSKINEMERQIALFTSQSHEQTITIAGQQITIADQQSRIADLEQRHRRDRRSIQSTTEKLGAIEAKERSARLEVVKLKVEVDRVTEQTQRFMALMERGAKVAEARVEQVKGQCQGVLELKGDELARKERQIASLEAQVARLERRNHELKGDSSREGKEQLKRGSLNAESAAKVSERSTFHGQTTTVDTAPDGYIPPPWKVDRPKPMEPGTAGTKRQADFGDQASGFEYFKLPRRM